MNLLTLTDQKLTALRQAIVNEASRRAKLAIHGLDAATIIYGNEAAKRAVQVAAAGRHSILFIGPSNSGKTMLRAVCLELGLEETFEARKCQCGNSDDPRATCTCTKRQIERTVAKFPVADISIQVFRPAERDRNYRGTSLAQMREKIGKMARSSDVSLDQHATNMLKASTAELGIDPATQERIIQVARTIANLECSERIDLPHICEAINYRALRCGY